MDSPKQLTMADQQFIIALRDEQAYHERRFREAGEMLKKKLAEHGLAGVEIALLPIIAQAPKVEDEQKTKQKRKA